MIGNSAATGPSAEPNIDPDSEIPLDQAALDQTDSGDGLPGLTAIFERLISETGITGIAALALAAVTGLFQAVVIAIIAGDAEELARRELGVDDLIIFCVALATLGLALHLTMRQAARTADTMVSTISQRLARRVQRAELAELEAIGPEAVHEAVTVDLTSIGTAGTIAFSTLKTLCLIAGSTLVIASIAPAVAVLGTTIFFAMAMLYRRFASSLRGATRAAGRVEDHFSHLSEQALDGFRELRLNTSKAHDLYDNHLLPTARAVAERRIARGTWIVRQLQTAHGTWFLLVGVACFIAPVLQWTEGVTTAVLILAFLRTPFVDISAYVPTLVGAGVSLRRLSALEHRLRGAPATNPLADAAAANDDMAGPATCTSETTPFRTLRLDAVSYTYTDEHGRPTWSVGPLTLEIKAGEIILVSGGNGSGKTTLLKLLTGLYPPRTGEVQLDGESVTEHALRPLISTVFADFHLFDRLYGLPVPDPEAVRSLLVRLDLDHKVELRDRAFSTTALSSGQRRRLALLAAIFERRPIMVFDEWTADQDPTFRRFFYSDILPELKRDGHTVIAVSHDDAPARCADRHLRMYDGRIIEDRLLTTDQSQAI